MSEIAERLLVNIDRLWTRFEETGEERWMLAAQHADRLYLRAKESA